MISAALCWGGHWVVARSVHPDVTPFATAFWRWVVAAAILGVLALPHLARDWPALRRQWRPMLLLAFAGTGFYNALGYIGIKDTTATNALLIQSMTPAFIPTLAFLILRQRTGLLGIAGLLVSCAGMAAIASRLDPEALLSLQLNRGDLWLMGNVIMWALYTVCLRWKPVDLHAYTFLFALSTLGFVQLIPFYAWEVATGGGVNWGLRPVLGLLYLGIFPAVLSYLMWNRAVAEIGAARASPYLYLITVFGIAMSSAILGERLYGYHAAGIALILAGVWLASRQHAGAVRG